MSRLVGKPTMWFPNRSDTNRPVHAQKRARSLKFRIQVDEELYYPSSEKKKALISFAFVFAYANCWFYHEAAQMWVSPKFSMKNVLYWQNLFILEFASGLDILLLQTLRLKITKKFNLFY